MTGSSDLVDQPARPGWCPLHGGTSRHPHAANQPPDIRDLLTDGLRDALAAEGLEGDQLEAAVQDLGDLARSEGRRLRAAAARAEAAGHPRQPANDPHLEQA